MAKKKTSKKTAKKTTKKAGTTASKKVTKKMPTKANKKVASKKTTSKKKSSKKVISKAPLVADTVVAEDAEEVIIPIKLEGEDLKKEIKELENADIGKKTPLPIKKPGRGGTRRVKPKHVVTARKAGPGLKFAPGVMLSGAKKMEDTQQQKAEPQEFRRMTPEELVVTRKKLIDLREGILENMRKELADYRQRASSSSADPIDQAADAYDDDVTFEIAANNDQELEQIDAALEKIEKGTYGLCEACSVTISPSRLKILPFATRCVECRESYEKTRVKKDSAVSWAFIDGEETETDG